VLFLVAPAYAVVDPVGWWKFDDGSGVTATDSGSGGNNGSFVNTPTWVAGHIGTGALLFTYFSPPDQQYVNVGTPTAVDITGNLTISVWFNATDILPAGDYSYQGLAGKGYDGALDTQQYLFRFSQDSGGAQYIDCGTYAAGNDHFTRYAFGTDITTGVWHNLICRFDGSTWKIYLDGTEKSSLTDGTPPQAGSANFWIADEDTSGLSVPRSFSGTLDDVRLYNRALTTQEIADLVNQTEGGAVVARKHRPIVMQ